MRRLLLCFLWLPIGLMAQSTLSVKVYNVPSSEGKIQVAVYDSDETFLKFEGVVKSGSTKAEKGTVVLDIDDIPQGEYAIAIFHDENGNDKLDTNWLGIPKEKVAFSNAKMRAFGPPKYEDCAFSITSDEKINIYF
nr:DUF2141 domain-containing protein [Allomuricauda sp.]